MIVTDLQMVNITCRVLSRPSIPALPTIYRELGQDYDERVLPSIVNEVLKSVVAQFNASQLITQREMVSHITSHSSFVNWTRRTLIGVTHGSGKLDTACIALQPRSRRCLHNARRFLTRVHPCRGSQTGMPLQKASDIAFMSIAQVAQQTALRAAFLVDQAIQEKQVRPYASNLSSHHSPIQCP